MKKDKSRILICGYEIGGQMQLLAETLRRRGYQADAVAFNEDARDFKNDLTLPPRRIPFRRLLFMVKALVKYDVFHFFWGVSLLDVWRFHGIDLPLLKLFGKRIVVHFRGTDIFNIEYYHYLTEKSRHAITRESVPQTRPDQKRKLTRWKKYADRILVSTPDLLELVGEGALLVPQAVDLNYWYNPAIGDQEGCPFSIAHAPTRRFVKGTEFLIAAVEALKQKGYQVELKLIENVRQEDVKEMLLHCTVGVDQLLHGWYGKAAVELMALGKPVICYLSPELIAGRPGVPMVNATPATLLQVLEALIGDDVRRKALREASVDYVRKYHDVEIIVDSLLVVYGINSEPG